MAQLETGFPWHAQAQGSTPQHLSEKVPDSLRKLSDTSEPPLTEATSRGSSSKVSFDKSRLSVKSGRRGGSVRTPNALLSPVKTQPDQRIGSSALPRRYNVRTIPPWIRDAEEDDLDLIAEEDLDSPHAALVAQHNHAPSEKRLAPAFRDVNVTSSGTLRPERTSRWITFARASAYPRENISTSEKVDTEWLDTNYTDYSKPWLAGQDGKDLEEGSGIYRAFRRKRQVWHRRMQITILRNPFVPLAFRFTVIIFAAVAIGLGTSIYNEASYIVSCNNQDPGGRTEDCATLIGQGRIQFYRDPSALMAVIVDCIAIAYTLYITYDEYFSKPLGLRSAGAKVRLILLDLFFIVFQAANLALAFASLTVDEGACEVGEEPLTTPRFDRICDRAQALSAVLTISLVAWLLTFSVSVFRLVERIATR